MPHNNEVTIRSASQTGVFTVRINASDYFPVEFETFENIAGEGINALMINS